MSSSETRNLRFALVGVNQTPMDWPGNARRIREAWGQARRYGAQLVCFPELSISGYGCEDMFLRPDVADRSLRVARELAAECGREILLVGLPFRHGKDCYNAVAVLNQGRIRALCLKTHLARDGIHYEPRWFRPWRLGEKQVVDIDGSPAPAGALTYDAAGLRFVLEVCEDAWTESEQRPCSLVADAQWVFNASASHFSMKKADVRERIVAESSKTFGIGYAYANLAGCESGRAIYDGELLVAENGRVVNRSKRLYLDDAHLLVHDIAYRPAAGQADVALDVEPAKETAPPAPPRVERQMIDPNEEFAAAGALALFDYMRKSRARGFTLSLSGGVDSSAVATLVHLMARRVIHELTPAARRVKLAYYEGLNPDENDPRALTGQWLTTVYQATRNSGEATRLAAAELAEAIGARHLELDVAPLVEGYRTMVSGALGRELRWDTDDLALQNIQARVRAPGVWMLANLNGSLLLTTSNRSEVAVGYATMDGDTCGGLAPIAGVEKTFLRRWLLLMERDGLPGQPPLPALARVNALPPTAELRPADRGQTDEDDLMPYEVLDALETELIFHRSSPLSCYRAVAAQFADRYPRERVLGWTEKFCRLFAASQWKRERYAPAFHLDDQNLDPKTWARFPILSGCFAEELAELRALAREDDP